MAKQTNKAALWLTAMALSTFPSLASAGAWPWPDRHRDLTGTWLDTFNFLDLIPGEPFVLFFIVYTVIVVLVIKLLANWWLPHIEGVSFLTLSEHVRFELKPTYLELAYLKGGPSAVIEVAACNLRRLGLVGSYLSNHTNALTLRPRAFTHLHGLERAVAAALAEGISPYALISNKRVLAALKQFETPTQDKLRRIGLLATRPTYRIAICSIILALAMVEGLGIIRLARSLMRGYFNVGFLLALMVTAVLAILWAFVPRLTRAGAKYLRERQSESQSLVRRVQAKMEAWDAPEVLYAVAACGAGALGGTNYATVHESLKPPRSPGGSDGCGGGSCGGGGCGGGGCGGGGCGGGGCGGG